MGLSDNRNFRASLVPPFRVCQDFVARFHKVWQDFGCKISELGIVRVLVLGTGTISGTWGRICGKFLGKNCLF